MTCPRHVLQMINLIKWRGLEDLFRIRILDERAPSKNCSLQKDREKNTRFISRCYPMRGKSAGSPCEGRGDWGGGGGGVAVAQGVVVVGDMDDGGARGRAGRRIQLVAMLS